MVLAFVMAMQTRRRRRRAQHAEGGVDPLDNVLDLIFAASKPSMDTSWFEMPWRDGRNAMQIARRYLAFAGPLHDDTFAVLSDIDWGFRHEAHQRLYEVAGNLLQIATFEMSRPWLHAYARMVMLWSANSDGGGYAYNALLSSLIEHITIENEIHFSEIVKGARCEDAIGTTYQLRNDGGDRVRQAFLTLWNGNHHRAIYALPKVH
jgi:hypothetical protein